MQWLYGLFLTNVALLQALLDPFGDIGRDEAPDFIHVLSGKGILSKRRLHDIVVEPEERLRGLLHAGILTREPSDEERVVAARVEFGVDGALREDGHLVRVELVGDAVGTVLEREFGYEAAFDDDVDLGTARVGVRGVEAAGTDEAEGHADAGADEGREDFAVCADGVAAFAACDGGRRGIVKVVDEVGVVSDEIDAVSCGGCELEGLD